MNSIIRPIIASLVLAVFGLLYNRWIGRQEARGRHEGYVSLYVVAGVLVVLAAAAWVVWPLGDTALTTIAVVLLLFVPAGLPMILGSITRHADARERAVEIMSSLAGRHEDD